MNSDTGLRRNGRNQTEPLNRVSAPNTDRILLQDRNVIISVIRSPVFFDSSAVHDDINPMDPDAQETNAELPHSISLCPTPGPRSNPVFFARRAKTLFEQRLALVAKRSVRNRLRSLFGDGFSSLCRSSRSLT